MLQGINVVVPKPRGPVAQLGARMTGSHEVEGSNPSRSTKVSNLRPTRFFRGTKLRLSGGKSPPYLKVDTMRQLETS